MKTLEFLNMEMSDRIRQRMDELDFKAVDVVSRTGLSKGTISQWLNGHTKPRGKNLLLLAEVLKASPEWIQFGVMSSASLDQQTTIQTWDIPILDVEVSAGHGTTGQPEAIIDTMAVPGSMLAQFDVQPNAARIVSVRGDSMESTLCNGDRIVVNTAEQQPVSGNIYAFEFDNELKVKRFLKNYDSSWTIRSDNQHDPAYSDQTVSGNNIAQLRIVGRVAGVLARKL